ncbi:MAG: hypothetical protein OEM81_12970 [Acidimicrobiia bacterium]|nr:hypothetical protein [Acidimicrobiia bacterium]
MTKLSAAAQATAHNDPKPGVPWTKIEEYVVTYPANTFSPRIHLTAESGEFAGQLVFMPNGTTLPADTQDQVHYHLDDFASVLDLLRNERPIYYIYNGAGDDNENGLQTGGTVGGSSEIVSALLNETFATQKSEG